MQKCAHRSPCCVWHVIHGSSSTMVTSDIAEFEQCHWVLRDTIQPQAYIQHTLYMVLPVLWWRVILMSLSSIIESFQTLFNPRHTFSTLYTWFFQYYGDEWYWWVWAVSLSPSRHYSTPGIHSAHFIHGSSSTMVTSDIDEFEQCHWVLRDTIQPQAYIQHTLYMVLPVLWWRVILLSLSSVIESFQTLFNPRHTFSTLYTWFFQYYGDEWYCWVWAVSLSPSRHYSTPGIHSAHFIHGSSSTMVTSDIDEFEQCHWVLRDTIQPQAYIQHTLYMVLPVLWWRVILLSLSSIIESFQTLFNPRHTFSTLYTWFFQYYGDEWYWWVWAVSLSPSRHYSTPGIHSAHFIHGSSSTMVTSDIAEFEQCHWVLPDTIQPQAYIQHTLYMVLPVLWWRVILLSLSSVIESFQTLFNPRHTFSTLYTWFFQYYGDEWYCWVWAVSLSPSRHYSTPGIHSAHFIHGSSSTMVTSDIAEFEQCHWVLRDTIQPQAYIQHTFVNPSENSLFWIPSEMFISVLCIRCLVFWDEGSPFGKTRPSLLRSSWKSVVVTDVKWSGSVKSFSIHQWYGLR